MPCRPVKVVPDAATTADSAAVASAIRRSRRRISLSSSAATWRKVRATAPSGWMLRSAAAAVPAVSPRGSPAGTSWASSACSRWMVCVRVRTRSSRCPVRTRRAAMASSTTAVLSRVAACARCRPTGRRPGRSCGRARWRASDAAGQLGRHVGHVDAVGRQPGSQRSTKACCAFDRPDRMGPAAGEAAQLPVACTIYLDADRGQGLQAVVDPRQRSRTLCGDRSAMTTGAGVAGRTTGGTGFSLLDQVSRLRRGGQTNFGLNRPLSSHSRRQLWSGRRPFAGQPEGGRCFPSDPGRSLEDHGCRP